MTARLAPPRDTPPLWLLLSLLLMLGLHLWLPVGTWLQAPWTWAGWALVAGGGVLAATSASRFERAGTGVKPFTPATALVTGGAYFWTRNPMYVGIVAIAAGVAVVCGTWLPALVPVLLLVLLDRRFVRAEETFLRLRFGAAYDEYRARVRRWV